MKMNRRKFLTLTAGSAVAAGFGVRQTLNIFANDKNMIGSQKALSVRWAMAIDLKKCKEQGGCTKCIDACHAAHNVPKFDNEKDEVKWAWKDRFNNAFTEQENHFLPVDIKNSNVLLMCNHCDKPPCTNVCPTQATWKREDGIVMMDWHRCVGCRYCVAACPFGSRSFNWREPRPFIKALNNNYPTRTRGVVEKCTFCTERISKGDKPLCVETCPVKSIAFGNINDPESDVRKILSSHYSIRRKPELGTQPEIYYIIS